MCCDPHGIGLAWATSVKLSQLGAHLEAHADTTQTQLTLRLCHRFGQGDKAYITRIPAEMLHLIIDAVVKSARSTTSIVWETERKCFELECGWNEHFSDEELDGIFEEASDSAGEMRASLQEGEDSPEDSPDESEEDERFDEEFNDACDRIGAKKARPICHARIDKFGARMYHLANACAKQTCLGEVLRREFGLTAYVAKHLFRKEIKDLFPSPDGPVCYLILPTAWIDEHTASNEDLSPAFPASVNQQSVRLSQRIREQFARAMTVLGLKPYVHPVQVAIPGVVDCTPQSPTIKSAKDAFGHFKQKDKREIRLEKSIEAKTIEYARSDWPKLMNLLPDDFNMILPCCHMED